MMNQLMENPKMTVRGLQKKGAVLLTLCACLGWWGVLYPQLSLTPDTYRIVEQDGTVQEGEDVIKWDFEGSIYAKILNADPGHVRFRSALLERLSECLEYWKKE